MNRIQVDDCAVDKVRSTLNAAPDINADTMVLLFYTCIERNQRDSCALMVERGFRRFADFPRWDAFIQLVRDNELDYIQQLVKWGVPFKSMHANGCTPLDMAITHNHLRIAEYMLELGCTVLHTPNWPLALLLQRKQNDMIRLLNRHGQLKITPGAVKLAQLSHNTDMVAYLTGV